MTLTPLAVLFDCDGVLVDSEGPTFDLLGRELADHALPLGRAEMEALFLGGTLPGLFVKARLMGATLPEDWVEGFYTRLYAHLAQGTALIPGVVDLLDRLDAAGIRYAVGSNGTGEKMQTTLGQHPATKARFGAHLYSGQTLGTPKPEPGLWLHAARALGVDAADCVVIDDSVPGCMAAARAGIRCLGFAEHDDGAALAETGAEVIHRLAEVPERIGIL